MKLYHGGLDIIELPEIREPNRTLDYGRGFYLTTSYEQAQKWVKRKIDENRVSCGYVNEYDYDPLSEKELHILNFESPTEEWLDFVMANRMDPDFSHEYDIVKGPVANDRVYAAFALYEARLYDRKRLIEELRVYKLVDQILLHTPKSLSSIRFIKAHKITT